MPVYFISADPSSRTSPLPHRRHGLILCTTPVLAQTSCTTSALGVACGAASSSDTTCSQQYINDAAYCFYCADLSSETQSAIQDCNANGITNLSDPSINWHFPPLLNSNQASSLLASFEGTSTTALNLPSSTALNLPSSTALNLPSSTALNLPSSTAASSSSSSGSGGGLPLAAIIGIVAGAAVALGALAGLIIFRSMHKKNVSKSTMVNIPPSGPSYAPSNVNSSIPPPEQMSEYAQPNEPQKAYVQPMTGAAPPSLPVPASHATRAVSRTTLAALAALAARPARESRR
ncbi:hypothetical protein BC937DRAFT_88933 [Endogone sp. FLAS-F59071]|nr:hypothetical protein BC937DRAFT_88933 [Endogone sp. FLAS-F59071]|eukprot:RUS18312.1 hypothetical protein BC937DRAFT_88933 [Endogone sp. FLAS-F59071]